MLPLQQTEMGGRPRFPPCPDQVGRCCHLTTPRSLRGDPPSPSGLALVGHQPWPEVSSSLLPQPGENIYSIDTQFIKLCMIKLFAIVHFRVQQILINIL